MEWSNKTVIVLNISSKNGGKTTLIHGNDKRDVILKKGEKKTIHLWIKEKK
jgi:alpha-L-fucosidase 2